MKFVIVTLEHFQSTHSRGSQTLPSTPVTVSLYPYKEDPDLKSAVQSDGVVTTAIKDSLDQLYDYGAIDYYEIYYWDYTRSDTYYPYWGDMTNCTAGEISENFKDFVQNDGDNNNCGTVPLNGSGHTHYDMTGVHQLVHNESTGCNETAGDYAPDGAGAERIGQTAFNEARVAWSPVCSNNTSLTEAAASQEMLHCHIHPDYDDTNQCEDSTTTVREHSLGTLNYYRDFNIDVCTPMLAYHWDDFDGSHNESATCPCPVDRESAAEDHTRTLTSCTKYSVENTANNV